MRDLCKFLGVEEGEVFVFDRKILGAEAYKVENNKLMTRRMPSSIWEESSLCFNLVSTLGISKTKHISEDEKVILRNLPKEFLYIARDSDNSLSVYNDIPQKSSYEWFSFPSTYFTAFNHLFQCVQWLDEEPTLIADLLKEDE